MALFDRRRGWAYLNHVPSYTSDEFIIPDVYAQGNGVSVFEWLQKDLSFSDEFAVYSKTIEFLRHSGNFTVT